VACVPRLAQDEPPEEVAIRPMAGEPMCRHLFVASRRGAEQHPALAAVMEALIAVARPAPALGNPAPQRSEGDLLAGASAL
jgi:hypothetical protein